MEKSEKIEILSYVYTKSGKKHTANARKADAKRGLTALNAEQSCKCGTKKCENGKVLRCLPVDNEGTCTWFVSDEDC